MSSSRGFGSTPRHKRPIRTRFRCGSGCRALTRRRRVTRRSILQKVRRHPSSRGSIGLRPRCKRRVSGLFHPPCGALFTFPSRYLFAIGHRGYLALDGGPPRFPPYSTCGVVLRIPSRDVRLFGYGAITRSGRPSQAVHLSPRLVTRCGGCRPAEGPTTPSTQRRQAWHVERFRLLPVRSPLLRE